MKRKNSAPQLLRLHHIARLAREGKTFNASSIACHFEVNARTIRRDIDWLRDFFRYPLAYDAKAMSYKLTATPPTPML